MTLSTNSAFITFLFYSLLLTLYKAGHFIIKEQ